MHNLQPFRNQKSAWEGPALERVGGGGGICGKVDGGDGGGAWSMVVTVTLENLLMPWHAVVGWPGGVHLFDVGMMDVQPNNKKDAPKTKSCHFLHVNNGIKSVPYNSIILQGLKSCNDDLHGI